MISSGIHKLGGNWQTMQAQKDTPDYFRPRYARIEDSGVLLIKKQRNSNLQWSWKQQVKIVVMSEDVIKYPASF